MSFLRYNLCISIASAIIASCSQLSTDYDT